MVAIFYIKFDFDKTKNGRSVSSVFVVFDCCENAIRSFR